MIFCDEKPYFFLMNFWQKPVKNSHL